MRGSQDELKSILQEKLHEYEVAVPGSTTDSIFENLKATGTAVKWKARAYYAGAAFMFLGLYLLYTGDRAGKLSEVQSAQITATPDLAATGNDFDGPVDTSIKGVGTEKYGANNRRRLASLSAKNDELFLTSLPVVGQGQLDEVADRESGSFKADDAAPEQKSTTEGSDDSAQLNKEEPKTDQVPDPKFRLGVNIMPLSTFSHVVPNRNDGAQLSGFTSPSPLSSDRFGFRGDVSVDYQLQKGRFIYGTLSYFSYRTVFSFRSNETFPGLNTSNVVNQQISGIGVGVGLRVPLNIGGLSGQYLSVGGETQFISSGSAAKSAWMLQAGYTKDFPMRSGTFRVQPTVSYSLTKFQYPGLTVHPFMIGIGVGYLFPVN